MTFTYDRHVQRDDAIAEIERLIQRGRELVPDPGAPAFTQWRHTTITRVRQLLPNTTTISVLSTLRFRPSDAEYFNAMSHSGPDIDPVARFHSDMDQAEALLRSAIEELEFDNGQEQQSMGNVNINRAGVAQLFQEIRSEFAKHGPIQIPIQGAVDGATTETGSGVTHNYNGPVFNVTANGDRAQVAFGETVNQNQTNTEEIAPGYEAIAQVVAQLLQRLPSDVSADDRGEIETASEELMAEVTQSKPDRSKVKRAVNTIKGVLAPIAMAAQTGVATGTTEFARHAIEQLAKAVT